VYKIAKDKDVEDSEFKEKLQALHWSLARLKKRGIIIERRMTYQ
jgi:hypothetical protein